MATSTGAVCRVPFLQLSRNGRVLGEPLREALAEVLECGPLVLGPRVERFEARFAKRCGCRHGLAVLEDYPGARRVVPRSSGRQLRGGRLFQLLPYQELRVPERERFCRRLAHHGIETLIHYDPPAHRHPAAPELASQARWLPVTEQACRQLVSLPLYPELEDEEVEAVIAAVVQAL